MSITNKLNQIKNAIYGKEVRGAIHDAIKQVYDDASVNHDNANMEVKMARGAHNTLNDRLDNVDEIQAQTNAQLSELANKGTTVEVLERVTKEEINKQIDDGRLANLMIADGSITQEKLSPDLELGVKEGSVDWDSLADSLKTKTYLNVIAEANWTSSQNYIVLSFDLGEELSTPNETIEINYIFNSPTYPTNKARCDIKLYCSDTPLANHNNFSKNEKAPLIINNTDMKCHYTATMPNVSVRYLNVFLYTTSSGQGATQTLMWKDIELKRNNNKSSTPFLCDFREQSEKVSLQGEKGFVVDDKRLITRDTFKDEVLTIIEEHKNSLNPDEKETVYLFGLHGQSNADGRANESTKPSEISEDVFYIHCPTSNSTIIEKGNFISDDQSSLAWIGKTLNDYTGEKIAILKYAVGGTWLVPQGENENSWYPSESNSYSKSAAIRFTNAYNELVKLGYNVVPVGFIWLQGESDITHDQDLYYQYFNDMVKFYENKVGFSDLKVFICEIGNNTSYLEECSTMRKTLHRIAENNNNFNIVSKCQKHFAENDMMQDYVHYNNLGYIKLGQEVGKHIYQYYFRGLPLPEIEFEG